MTEKQYLRTGIRIGALFFFFLELRNYAPLLTTLGSQDSLYYTSGTSLLFNPYIYFHALMIVLPIVIWLFPWLIMPAHATATTSDKPAASTPNFEDLHYVLVSILGLWFLFNGTMGLAVEAATARLSPETNPMMLQLKPQIYWNFAIEITRFSIGVILTFKAQRIVSLMRQCRKL